VSYVRGLIPPLVATWGKDDVVVLADAACRKLLEGVPCRFDVREVPDARLARLRAERRLAPEIERAHGTRIVFWPTSHDIIGRVRSPSVVALHHHVNFSRPRGMPLARRLYWLLWHDWAVRRTCARAAALLAPTTTFAEEFARHVPSARGKMAVIHHGVSRLHRPPSPEERRGTGAAPSVLAVSNEMPYKNLDGTLRIFKQACEGLPHELRIAGVDEATVHAAATRIGLDDATRRRLRVLGILSESRLAQEYRASQVLLFPTFEESFGMPVAEAMASGLPVACSDLPALREVTLGAATLVDPKQEGRFALELRSLLTDASRAEVLRTAGLERAKAFSWERAAGEVADVLSRVLATRSL
jgi:glycosyltransferase involved in cell wall biosynthesis